MPPCTGWGIKSKCCCIGRLSCAKATTNRWTFCPASVKRLLLREAVSQSFVARVSNLKGGCHGDGAALWLLVRLSESLLGRGPIGHPTDSTTQCNSCAKRATITVLQT